MKTRLLNLWRHPVWSNVFAALIVIALTSTFNLLNSYFNATDFKTEFNRFWNFEVKIWWMCLVGVSLYAIALFIKKAKGRSFFYDNETLNLDRQLFDKIRHELIDNKVVLNLKSNAFSSRPIDVLDLSFIDDSIESNDDPNFEFINPALEKLRDELFESIKRLHGQLSNNLFGTNIESGDTFFVAIPNEWDLERHRAAQMTIEAAENDVFEKFERLVKCGRRILKI